MSRELDKLHELEVIISDRIYLQIQNWNLSLGDAGLSKALAIECQANINEGVSIAVRKACEAVEVNLGGGKNKIPLYSLIPQGQISDLEDILDKYLL